MEGIHISSRLFCEKKGKVYLFSSIGNRDLLMRKEKSSTSLKRNKARAEENKTKSKCFLTE